MNRHIESECQKHSIAKRIVEPTEKAMKAMKDLGFEWRGEERISVRGPCWNRAFDESGEDECHCNEYENADPKVVGYPPFHKGCTCVVERG